MKKRIVEVLHYKKPGFWLTVAGIIAVLFVAVCLVTSPKAEGSAPEGEAAEMLALCRKAVGEFQGLESVYVRENRTYVSGYLSVENTRFFYQNGEDWFRMTGTTDSLVQYLQKDGAQFYQSTLGSPNAGNLSYLEWTELESDDEVLRNHWLKELDWNDDDYRYLESGSYEENDNTVLTVTLAAEGRTEALLAGDDLNEAEVTLTFHIRESDGQLHYASQTVVGRNDVGQTVVSTSFLTVGDTIASRIKKTIDSHYAQVLSQEQEREDMLQRCMDAQTQIYDAVASNTPIHIRGTVEGVDMNSGHALELYYAQGKTYMRQDFANTGRTSEYLSSLEDKAFYSRDYVTNKFEDTNSGWKRTKGKKLNSFVQEIEPAMLENAEIQLITANEWSGMRFIIRVDDKTTWTLVYQSHEDGSITVERDVEDGTLSYEGSGTVTILTTLANEIVNIIDFKLNEAREEAQQRNPS